MVTCNTLSVVSIKQFITYSVPVLKSPSNGK